jgi:CRP-like cAMP-binding protein
MALAELRSTSVDETIRELASRYPVAKVSSGKPMFDATSPANPVGILLEGAGMVIAYNGDESTWIDIIEPGAIITEHLHGSGECLPMIIESHGPSLCIRLNDAQWRDVSARYPILAKAAANQRRERAARAMERLVDIKTMNAAARLGKTLMQLRDSPLVSIGEDGLPFLKVTRKELADLVAVSERHLPEYLRRAAKAHPLRITTKPRLCISYMA